MAPRAKSDYAAEELIMNAVEQVVGRGGKEMLNGNAEEAGRLFDLARAVISAVDAYKSEAVPA